MLVHLMTECPVLEDARSHHFDEDDPITFLFNEPEVALSYLRDAGLTKAGRVWSLIERQKKTTTTTKRGETSKVQEQISQGAKGH